MARQSLIRSVNPATEEVIDTFEPATSAQIEQALSDAQRAYRQWRQTSFAERAALLQQAAAYLRQHQARLAGLITAEMGKPIAEAEAEVEKCAWNCVFYAENAERFLHDEPHPSGASESYVAFTPLGTVLAIMPWNFPFWQVIRFAAPALMAGNTAILKHASNVPQCALALAEVFAASGFPKGAFQSLLVPGSAVTPLIEDPRVAAVTLTGSDEAGSQVAAAAGRVIKKTVMELGGSDPFIVLADADLDAAVATAVRTRYQNAGQSCIAAKRFIVAEEIFEAFQERFVEAVQGLRMGDPTDRSTQLGPLARDDLRDSLEQQVRRSTDEGAKILVGGRRQPGRGYYFAPTVLTDVRPEMPASCEEVFGPVAALLKVRSVEEAIRVANDSPYGLGANLWTSDLTQARRLARDIEAGQVFINGMVASDPRLPFGGVKRSGYGRELSAYGIREFVNIQTVWIGPAKQ
ncbi:MAG TPA: NAD-dependent succinate-semialdehyde dehydrogenase [Candidatus Tectomicrobia bacterium]|nr:NAD-dependent succinate-semialdehyde dehydrogenase [Candidatus Tectomicrobia bacterium]